MTADTASLQERLWEAVAEVRDQHPRVFNDAPTDDVIAAIVPIIAAEVQAAKAEALREAAEDLFYDGDQDVPIEGNALLHSRADEYETGDRA